ncbi:MAG: class I SAM-dependent methyltransferase [Candidatus Thorarchaeota archaeon]
MDRKNNIPKFPESYLGDKSNEYENSASMERNQKRTTLITLQYLFDEKLNNIGFKDVLKENTYLILDLGCGTGFSTEILLAEGFRVIAVDILIDMLSKAVKKKHFFPNNKNVEYLLADINHLPFRINSIDLAISISAYNFITHGKEDILEINKTINYSAKYLHEILKQNGRFVLEFYPKDDDELNFFISSFINNGFKGFMVKNNHRQKGGQTFLLLKSC